MGVDDVKRSLSGEPGCGSNSLSHVRNGQGLHHRVADLARRPFLIGQIFQGFGAYRKRWTGTPSIW